MTKIMLLGWVLAGWDVTLVSLAGLVVLVSLGAPGLRAACAGMRLRWVRSSRERAMIRAARREVSCKCQCDKMRASRLGPLADVLEIESPTHFGLLGRANDLIHVAGKRSSLAQLDFQLNRIPGVADGAFWMPDEPEDGVARPVALVVSDTLDAEAVRRALRQVLEPAFVPRRVLMVPSLPREGTGKLTAQGLARFARDALAEGPRFTVATDHPAFAGHFPSHPLLPGVALLAYVMRALAADAPLAARMGAQPQIAAASS
jgi:acyl-CoA synthetase (AMP-forming)/AMP-acid ligase II